MDYTKGECYECGCYIEYYEGFKDKQDHIIYCPKHSAAPDMYKALKIAATRIHNHIRYEQGEYREMLQRDLKEILKALAKADNKVAV